MVYEKVRELCDENGVTIYELEKKCGLSNGVIQKWKKANPTLKNIEKVALYFGKPVDYFCDENKGEPIK